MVRNPIDGYRRAFFRGRVGAKNYATLQSLLEERFSSLLRCNDFTLFPSSLPPPFFYPVSYRRKKTSTACSKLSPHVQSPVQGPLFFRTHGREADIPAPLSREFTDLFKAETFCHNDGPPLSHFFLFFHPSPPAIRSPLYAMTTAQTWLTSLYGFPLIFIFIGMLKVMTESTVPCEGEVLVLAFNF